MVLKHFTLFRTLNLLIFKSLIYSLWTITVGWNFIPLELLQLVGILQLISYFLLLEYFYLTLT
jgi:predicted acyltransferase